ncbi:MAG: hypothetical protein MR512_01290 [Anaerococcus sp.]|nr:hypothetical protein [Anaerococcus sp.]
MKKQSITDLLLRLLIGLIFPIAYYFAMAMFFKVNPFEGYYWIPTIYIIVCYLLFPISERKFSEATHDKNPYKWLNHKINTIIPYLFAPFILIKYRDR